MSKLLQSTEYMAQQDREAEIASSGARPHTKLKVTMVVGDGRGCDLGAAVVEGLVVSLSMTEHPVEDVPVGASLAPMRSSANCGRAAHESG